MPKAQSEKIYSQSKMARLLGCSVPTLKYRRQTGLVPPWDVTIGKRHFWSEAVAAVVMSRCRALDEARAD